MAPLCSMQSVQLCLMLLVLCSNIYLKVDFSLTFTASLIFYLPNCCSILFGPAVLSFILFYMQLSASSFKNTNCNMLLPRLNAFVDSKTSYKLPCHLAPTYISDLILATVSLLIYFQVPSYFEPSLLFA